MEEEKIEAAREPLLATKQERPKKNKYALGCGVLASMTTILMGYHVAVMSGAQKYMQEDLGITDTQIEILSGVINVYSLAGSLAAGCTSDWIGRRATIILASIIFFVGAVIMSFATNFAILMTGRFVAGMAMGYALMIAPVYTSEISPASMRGFLSSLPEVFINSGVLLSYVSNLAFSGFPINLGWRLMFDVAVISGAQKYMQEDLGVSNTQIEILSGILNLASLFGSFAASYTSDRIGRRATITIASAIFFVGSLVITFATNFVILLVGRFVTGIAVGYALMIAPVYTSEISPTSMRGLLSSLPEVFINSGILLSYVSNLAFSGFSVNISWRLMFGIAAIPPAFLACGILAMPESPRWLVMRGHLGEARRVLVKTSDSPEEADARLQDIKEVVGIPLDCNEDVVIVPRSEKNKENIWKEMFTDQSTPAVKRIIFTVIIVQFFQQASGTEAVVLYTPRVLAKAGLKSDTELLGATILVGLAKLGFILVATFTSDKLGRRLLFLLSAGGMVISYVALGFGLEIIDWTHEENFSWAAVVCILAVVAVVMSFSIGFGPLAWVYSSEILPLRLRGQGASLGTVMNRIMSGVVAVTFISLYEAITVAGSFFLFAGITAIGWVFIYFCLPETKGRSLEDIEMLFE